MASLAQLHAELIGKQPHSCGEAVCTADYLDDSALAKQRLYLASGPGHHHALEALLRGGAGSAHGRAIPLIWQTLEHPSASVCASVSIALLEKADWHLAGFQSITLLADRAFRCDELLRCFRGRYRRSYVMRLGGYTEFHATSAHLCCMMRPIILRRGNSRVFRWVS